MTNSTGGELPSRRVERPEHETERVRNIEGGNGKRRQSAALGGLLGGLGGLIEKLGELAEAGEELSRSGEVEGRRRKNPRRLRHQRQGRAGRPRPERAEGRAVRQRPPRRPGPPGGRRRARAAGQRLEEDDHVLVLMELPGVAKATSNCRPSPAGWNFRPGAATLPTAPRSSCRRTARRSMTWDCRNGILQARFDHGQTKGLKNSSPCKLRRWCRRLACLPGQAGACTEDFCQPVFYRPRESFMSESATATQALTLKVSDRPARTWAADIARIDPADMAGWRIDTGDLVEVAGPRDHGLQAAAGLQGAARQRPPSDRRHRPRKCPARPGRAGRGPRAQGQAGRGGGLRPAGPHALQSRSGVYRQPARRPADGAGDRVRATLFGNRRADSR